MYVAMNGDFHARRRALRLDDRSELQETIGAGLAHLPDVAGYGRGRRSEREIDTRALLRGERRACIDLANQTIVAGNPVVPFAIGLIWKTQLLNGFDEVDLTLAEQARIDRFRAEDASVRPEATRQA